MWSKEHASLSTGAAMEVNEDLSLALANLQRIGSVRFIRLILRKPMSCRYPFYI